MTPAPFRAVVDASVAAKIFVPERLSAQAHAVFARLVSEDGAELIVPDVFFLECANVFRKWVRRSGYPDEDARAHLRDLTGLGLTVVPVQVLAEEAPAIALTYAISVYDACYVAAAVRQRLPLITADEKLVASLAKGSCDVRRLGDVTWSRSAGSRRRRRMSPAVSGGRARAGARGKARPRAGAGGRRPPP